jgi:uncharacterized protein (TIGR02246 family)
MFRILFIILVFSSAMTFAQTQNETFNESAGTDTFLNDFNGAWNTHNAKAMASLWTDDGDLMTPWGQWIMSRSQIEKYFDKEQKGPFGKSTIIQTIDGTRFLTPQHILLDTTIKLDGILDRKGGLPTSLLQHGVYVLIKKDNKWQIVSARIFMFQPKGSE